MELDYTKINGHEFDELQGEQIITDDVLGKLTALFSSVHSGVDVTYAPFWVTKIQDIIEETCVTYTKEDIEENNFLGVRIETLDDIVEISLGLVGHEESLFIISFKKELGTNGIEFLGKVLRFGTVGQVA